MGKVEHDNKEGSNWPWDYQKEEPTLAVLSKIVHNLPSYAYDALEKKPEEVGMTDSLQGCFQIYCHVVKDHFEKVAKNAPVSDKKKLSEIAEEAFDLIDKFLEYVNKRLNIPFDMRHNLSYPYSYWELNNKWDTLVRTFNLCISSQGAQNVSASKGWKHGKDKLNKKVGNCLKDHPKWNSAQVATECDSSDATVRGTKNWKQRENRPKKKKQKKRKSKKK